MEVKDIVIVVVQIVGVISAVILGWRAAMDARGNHQFTYAENSLKLREQLIDLGPLKGKQASVASDQRHGELINGLEREARMFAAHYRRTLSRRSRRGSIIIGTYCTIAGSAVAFTSTSIWDLIAAPQPVAGVAAIGLVVIGAASLVLFISGVDQIGRRIETRKVRTEIGEVDELTVEFAAKAIRAIHRQFSREPR